ncbi:hypothetical protein EW146_g1148 [Bondarzewia mesenterica]|uniref:Transcription factor IIIC subunit 5 HTH domain-containing protein n=1 Tax=Bondarzewia mesenterica TaxID=1095465 RepID=A0A4S4M4L4_9AGAM|nr:hypothetical protein EW146_g1148 [Bondarzewia mesenterica]
MLGQQSFRLAFRTISAQRLYRPIITPPVRHLSVTPRRQAAELPSDFVNNIKHTELFKKLADKPDALKALSDLATLVKENGIDINSTTPPSNMELFRLATNRKFIRGVKHVLAELKKAGIDMDSEDAMQDIMFMAKGKPPKGDAYMEAGPSSTASTSLPVAAPEHPLPTTSFYSIEYPGYVRPASVPQAVHTMGGQSSLNAAFRKNASKHDGLLELNMRPNNPFSHPIPGDVVPTSNILLKVVKRKRRKLNPETGETELIGEYTADAIGVISKTARFYGEKLPSGMADYQFQPDMNDPIAKLRMAMGNMDVDTIRQFRIPAEKEDYVIPKDPMAMAIDPQLTDGATQGSSNMKSNLRLFPPPLFSRQSIPQNYNFKSNPMSVVATTVDEETGEEKKRLINKMRWKGFGPASIMFSERDVPKNPPPNCEEIRDQFDQKLLKALEERFQERPIWTRAALLNQFTAAEAREIHNSKVLLPLSCYVFQDGPWRDTLVRFGYDPREEKRARFYQRLYFRNLNHAIVRPSVITRRQETRHSITTQKRANTQRVQDDRRSHIFDGVTITKETAAFQLCDIEDPLLKEMIEDEEEVRETCNERDGWYTTHQFERIKAVLRLKFFSLLEGHIVTDEECAKVLATPEGLENVKRIVGRRLRPGKHNMAKGALPPDQAAAIRLSQTIARATQDKGAGAFQNQG